MGNREVALALAAAGLAVFPCHPGGPEAKRPLRGVFWRSSSTTDTSKIHAWWDRHGDAVPAIDLAKSGFVVIDADRHGGPDGVAAWQSLCRQHGVPPHPTDATPSGGLHSWFRQPADPVGNSRGALPPGVDVRGVGGYVIAPGAVMQDGSEYRLAGSLDDAPPLPAWLEALLRARRENAPPPPAASAAPSDRYAAAAMDQEIAAVRQAGPGTRNQQLNASAFSLGQLVGAGALSAADVSAALEQAAHDNGLVKDDGIRSVRASIRSGLTAGQKQPRQVPAPSGSVQQGDLAHGAAIARALVEAREARDAERARSDLEWFDDIRPVIDVPYLVKSLIDRGTMSVIYGPSNSGKTFFALDLAFHIAIDQQWRDRRVVAGSVLYLAAEGGNGIANRIAGLRKVYGSVDVPLALRRAGLDLLRPDADVRYVIALAQETAARGPLAIIVIDTLSRVIAGGDENAAADMTAFIKNVDSIRAATGAHIMIVHHTGKDAAKGARGHSSLRAATDTEIELALDESGTRFAKVTKQRDYEGGEEFAFALRPVTLGEDQDGDEVSTCIVEPVEREAAVEGLPSKDVCQSILREIQTAWNAGNPYSMTVQSQRTGRFAPRALGQKFGIKHTVTDRLLRSWIDNAVLRMDKFSDRDNRSGLRVIGSIT